MESPPVPLLLLLALLAPALCVPAASDVRRAISSSPDGINPAGSPYNPMNPFLSLKPFLPSKPTFFPPVVDPNYFIGQKAALLNGLFSSKTAGLVPGKTPATYETKRTLPAAGFSPMAFGPDVFISKKTAFLNQLFKQLATPPPDAAEDTSQDLPTTADPNIATYNKIALLNILLKQLASPTPSANSAAKRAVSTDATADMLSNLFLNNDASPSDSEGSFPEKPVSWSSFAAAKSPVAKPTIVPPGFWSAFIKPAPPVKPTIVPPSFWFPAVQPVSTTMKPTIVPPSFWLPFAPGSANTSTALPVDPSVFMSKKAKFLQTLFSTLQTTPAPPADPVDVYSEKVNEFLDKLFSSLQVEQPSGVARRSALPVTSTDPVSSLVEAKSKIVSSIIAEMTSVKNSMLDTVDDIVKKQKEVVTAASSFVPGKKPFASPYAGMWGGAAAMGKPTPDPTAPLKQKLKFLDQLFDSLAKMEKDVTDSVNKVVSKQPTNPTPSTDSILLALLKDRVQGMANSTSIGGSEEKKGLQEELQRRGIKMAVHQGYQSLPPGAEEILQAGGGGEADGQEGGGLKLQIKVPV
ncbi:uncharacterized protein LOC134530585 isoform X2 [Bacillus rossius redtenbacheri]|uniref:uncharacterized protein LOC134530585 isoform X2 n=1 Tax=Bacillus rossius redtenbacheri TaxID=93214 RepID=UPI002FDE997F